LTPEELEKYKKDWEEQKRKTDEIEAKLKQLDVKDETEAE